MAVNSDLQALDGVNTSHSKNDDKSKKENEEIKARVFKLFKEMNQQLWEYHYGNPTGSEKEATKNGQDKQSADAESNFSLKPIKEQNIDVNSKLKPLKELLALKKSMADSGKITTIVDLSHDLRNYLIDNILFQFSPDHSINLVNRGRTPISFIAEVPGLDPLLKLTFIEELLNCPDIDLTLPENASIINSMIWFCSIYQKDPMDDIMDDINRLAQIFKRILELCPQLIQNLYLENPNGEAYLTDCTTNKHVNVLKVLHQKGANLNYVQKDGNTPLFAAAVNSCFDTVQYLVNARVDLNPKILTDNHHHFEESIFHNYAYDCEENTTRMPEIIAYLLAAGAKYNPVNQLGRTPYETTQLKPAQFPAYVNIQDISGEFHINRRMLAYMFKSIDDFFALMKTSHVKLAKEALDMGIPIQSQNAQGQTPLHVACQHGTPEMVKLLLNYGAKITSIDDQNHTPLDVAAQFNPKNLPPLMNRVQHYIDIQVLLMKSNVLMTDTQYNRFPRTLFNKIWEYTGKIEFANSKIGKDYIFKAMDRALLSKGIQSDAAKMQEDRIKASVLEAEKLKAKKTHKTTLNVELYEHSEVETDYHFPSKFNVK